MLTFPTLNEYEQKALERAEKYGIIDYKVIDNKMVHREFWRTEGTYEYTFNLDRQDIESIVLIEKQK